MNGNRVYLRYTTCTLADYVRVIQCYRCQAFGHIAKDCKAEPFCGHCAEKHERRNCNHQSGPPRCINCLRQRGADDELANHSATDAKRCPILRRRIEDRVANINYG